MEKINGGTLCDHIKHHAKIGKLFSREEQKYVLRSLLGVVLHVHGKFHFFYFFLAVCNVIQALSYVFCDIKGANIFCPTSKEDGVCTI
jgi:hypothetical protein